MAIVRDEEEQKGQGTSQALAQGVTPGQPQPQQEQQQPAQTSGPAMLGSSAGAKPSAPVKAMPKQQKAGTGTFANLKSYLQAAQGGGQQRVAQAATQKVESTATGAQKSIQQAQKTFGQRMDAASLANMETAGKEAADIIGAARGVTYQAPQPAATLTQEQVDVQNQARMNYTPELKDRVGGPVISPEMKERERQWTDFRDSILGDKKEQFNTELASIKSIKDLYSLYDKYGIDRSKFTYIPKEDTSLRKGEVVPEPTTPAVAPAPTQPQQYFTPEQQQRFAEIINAQYQGPQSLQEAGLYEQAARKAKAAETAVNLSRTAAGREQLLKDIFSRGRDYSRGASKLDALLLNASQQGVGQVQQAAEKAGDVRQVLQQAQNLSANEATNRAKAIQDIASGARTAFTEGRTAEEQATNERIKAIQDNWNKLPDYLKDVLKSGRQLSQQEADLLGITAGTGIYNLTPEDVVKTNAAEAARLISKNELSRQLALSQLAGLDKSKQLQKDLLYTDLEKAGTQTAADVINKQAIKDLLTKEEETFREKAAQQNVVGYGRKKNKTSGKYYYADETANLKELLSKAGYDFNAPLNQQVRDVDVSGNVSFDKDPNAIFEANVSGTGVLQGIGNILGSPTGYQLGNAIAGLFGGGTSSKASKAKAAQLARRDLERKVEKALQDAGFYNRAAIGETEETKARQSALARILELQEKYRG